MNTIFLRRVNVGNDAQIKQVADKTVIEFSVADNRSFKNDKGEKIEVVSWFRCAYWSNKTGIAQYLKKGASVNVLGHLIASAYTNKQGGPAIDLTVTVSEIDLLSKIEKENSPVPTNDVSNDHSEESELPVFPTQSSEF